MRSQIPEEVKQSCIAFKQSQPHNGLAWHDITSYSQGDKERVPTIFETWIAKCRIGIVRGHIHYPDNWIVSCGELGINQVKLNSKFAKDAADEAFMMCYKKAAYIAHELGKLIQP